MKINFFPSASLLAAVLFCALLIVIIPGGHAINCYTCSSWNGSDVDCHDPFNPANSVYTKECMVGKAEHVGMFPASFCLKIIGQKAVTGELQVIRACILENMDNQCGMFRYENDSFSGCILTCDYNGCNQAADLQQPDVKYWIAATVATLLFGFSSD